MATTAAAPPLLSARLADPPPLREIARAVGYAPFHLARLFRREAGLRSTGSDTNAFRREFGATPSRLRALVGVRGRQDPRRSLRA